MDQRFRKWVINYNCNQLVTVDRYSGKHCSDSRAISFFPSLSWRGAAGSDSRAVSFFPCFSLTIPFWRVSEYMFAARPAPNYRRVRENTSWNAGINRAPRRPKNTRVRARGGHWNPRTLEIYPFHSRTPKSQSISVCVSGMDKSRACAGSNAHLWSELRVFSELWPRPGVLGFPDRVFSVSYAGRPRLPAPNRVFSVSCTGCSRLPWPGVLGLLRRAFSASCSSAGCSRLPWPDVLGLLRRAFSISTDRDRRFLVTSERVTPRRISPGLQRG